LQVQLLPVESGNIGIPINLKETVKEKDVDYLAESAFADAYFPATRKI
jgi:hypothetical protein